MKFWNIKPNLRKWRKKEAKKIVACASFYRKI